MIGSENLAVNQARDMVMREGEVGTKVPKIKAMEEGITGSNSHELEERIKKAEGRIIELEVEIGTRNMEYEELEVKYKALELEKLAIASELDALKARKSEIDERNSPTSKVAGEQGKEVQGTALDLTAIELENDDDELFQLKAENLTLEHEKKKAEKDAQVWKQKYHDLKSTVVRSFEETMAAEDGATHGNSGTPNTSNLPSQHKSSVGEHRSGGMDCKKARRSLFTEEERNHVGKMAPSTPVDPKPSCPNIINLDDSDDEPNDMNKVEICNPGRDVDTEKEKSPERCLEDDDMDVRIGVTPKATTPKRKRAANMVTSDSDSDDEATTPKRKRAANMVTSDSDSDDDDNITLSKWKEKHAGKVSSDANVVSKTASSPESDDDIRDTATPRRRRLKRLSQCAGTSDAQYKRGIPTTKEDAIEIESEEEGSESSGDSMKGFIVESSDDEPDGSGEFHEDDASDPGEEGDCNSEMQKILSGLQRRKDQKFKWKLEGEMLADFGKDPELCMRAVCAVYRQQTADEQVSREAIYANGRGFSKFDAYRGCEIGGFLTGGSSGDMIKSVEELEEHDPKAVEKCKDLAFRYAKQVFAIYQNKEDPFFKPSEDED